MPWQLRACTPREINLMLAGALWRYEREIDRGAMAVALGNGNDPLQLLGRKFGQSRIAGYAESGQED